MSFLKRHPISLALAVAAVLSIQLVPQSTFFSDDYIQLGILVAPSYFVPSAAPQYETRPPFLS